MIHASIDLVPFGVDEARQTLVDIYIGNDGTGTRDYGNYDVYVEDPRGKSKDGGRHNRPGWVGRVEHFPRGSRQAHVSALVGEAIKLVVSARANEGPAHDLALAAVALERAKPSSQ